MIPSRIQELLSSSIARKTAEFTDRYAPDTPSGRDNFERDLLRLAQFISVKTAMDWRKHNDHS